MADTGAAVVSQSPAVCVRTPRPWAEWRSFGLPVVSPPVRAAVQPNCPGTPPWHNSLHPVPSLHYA
ncbi:hypothetical protein OH77DRAFT_154052 [Trametes cingulata]|nr:hypothetical protein OH77DRAFT_154052 [Trametes cingulata]